MQKNTRIGVRRAEIAYADGKALCSAGFTINPEDKYFRITVIDNNGKRHVQTAILLMTCFSCFNMNDTAEKYKNVFRHICK